MISLWASVLAVTLHYSTLPTLLYSALLYSTLLSFPLSSSLREAFHPHNGHAETNKYQQTFSMLVLNGNEEIVKFACTGDERYKKECSFTLIFFINGAAAANALRGAANIEAKKIVQKATYFCKISFVNFFIDTFSLLTSEVFVLLCKTNESFRILCKDISWLLILNVLATFPTLHFLLSASPNAVWP